LRLHMYPFQSACKTFQEVHTNFSIQFVYLSTVPKKFLIKIGGIYVI